MVGTMIRKRDFVLFLLVVVFLVIGIGATLAQQFSRADRTGWDEQPLPPAQPVATYTATSSDAEREPDRAQRRAALRAKLAELGDSVLGAPESDALEPDATSSRATSSAPDTRSLLAGGVERCPNYATSTVGWQPAGLTFNEVEGARLLERAIAAEAARDTTATVTASLPPEQRREVVVQLPLRTLPAPSPSCLPSDVVGIATDGSLIRNDEASIYAIFGAETLVGYALDGFPIYGRNDRAQTDMCGGHIVGDSYRYVLSSEREVVVRCFSAQPIAL